MWGFCGSHGRPGWLPQRPVRRAAWAGRQLLLVLAGDAGFRQVIADPGENFCGSAVGMLFLQSIHDEVKGALDLPAGEQVRAVLPVLDHASGLVMLPRSGPVPPAPGQTSPAARIRLFLG